MTSAARSNSAKRSASGNLSNSSDDEQDDHLRELDCTRSSVSSEHTTHSTVSDSGFDTNSSLDCSDNNPCSPGASSTCSGSSGPVYIRPPGFKYHAQEITRPKIKKKKKVFPFGTSTKPQTTIHQGETILRKREPTPPKHRHIKRDPLPMRLRAFPQSFWQQPNQPVGVSPAHCHKVLPPLSIKEEIDMVRPVTPPDDSKLCNSESMPKDKSPMSNNVMSSTSNNNLSVVSTSKSCTPQRSTADRKIIVTGNPETLLTKLFENVDEKVSQSKKPDIMVATGASYKVPIPPSNSIRRTRTKHQYAMNKTMLHGSDPYMVDTIADKLFPHLTLEKAGVKSSHNTGGNTSIQLITLKEGDKSVTLPSLCVEQNYSQMLSEIVPYL